MVASALYNGNVSALWYNIGPLSTNYSAIDETAGISKFWFEVTEGDGSVTTEDQNGAGFLVQDSVMVANSTCIVRDPDDQFISTAHVQIAVSPSLIPLLWPTQVDSTVPGAW